MVQSQHSVILKETAQQPKSNVKYFKYLLDLSKNFKEKSTFLIHNKRLYKFP